MDNHQALYKKVLDFARNHKLVRLVTMNGSRVNPNIKPDHYQDFDIVFYVSNFDLFMLNKDFVFDFGDILIMQTKDDQRDQDNNNQSKWYIYLTQFKDGSRLDLSILDMKDLDDTIHSDSLTKVLLDKDHLIHDLNQADESSYYIKKPSKKDISMTVNEFYWVSLYVGKGLARNHTFYAIKHLDILRNEVERIIDWWIAYQYDFQLSVGKGKHRYIDLLPEKFYLLYKETYTDANVKNIWSALFKVIDLFDQVFYLLTEYTEVECDKQYKKKIKQFIIDHYKNSEGN
ncbi:aminoglycoside 6-adenylyltransferase [Mycoplasmatota bacterium]|nr:aminoglycoside 6-adenylyltransferase [Mycoplasmatota bacterium]